MKELFTLNRLIFRYKWLIFWGSLFIIAANLVSVYSVRFVGKAINYIDETLASSSSAADFKQLLFYGFLIIALPIVSGILTFFQRQTIIVASRHIEFDLKNEIFQHYQELDTAFYKKNRIGDLMNRISEDVGYVRMYLGPGIMYPINLISLSIILVIEMILIDKSLTFYTLAPLPVLSILIYFISRHINIKSREVQEEQSNLSSYVQDIFSGIRVIKSFNRENRIKRSYAGLALDYKKKSISLANIQAFFFPLMLLVIGISQILILYAGGTEYIQGEITEIGTVAQFFMYLNMLIWPFASLGWISMVVQRAEASMKRINEFLQVGPSVYNMSRDRFEIKGKIEFDNVSFTYENTGITALKNLSFVLPQGQTLAVLGKTGSGKTTLAELVIRLYDPSQGEIRLDDTALKNINLNDLRSQIGFVPQEAFLFSDTLEENIAFALDHAEPEKTQEFAKKADVHHNIIDFKEGYQTKVGERGVTLSGGQKQRISIARALIKNPKILIFDDSLSAVDTETEENILQNIREASAQKTTIIITHRISSAKHADKIIMLHEGQIIQKGTHQSLLAVEGAYRDLYEIQLNEEIKD
ncbi:MAG: ABC transporter ATP-binding protein [Flavobacteriaceae bacterium]|nr:ABC transporter ATP-binding protein [Flavobacteriaceae bacterium]